MPETERPKFLLELLAEVDNFDAELFPPKAPVSKDKKDTVVGTRRAFKLSTARTFRWWCRMISNRPKNDCIVDGERRRRHRFDPKSGRCTLCGAKKK